MILKKCKQVFFSTLTFNTQYLSKSWNYKVLVITIVNYILLNFLQRYSNVHMLLFPFVIVPNSTKVYPENGIFCAYFFSKHTFDRPHRPSKISTVTFLCKPLNAWKLHQIYWPFKETIPSTLSAYFINLDDTFSRIVLVLRENSHATLQPNKYI